MTATQRISDRPLSSSPNTFSSDTAAELAELVRSQPIDRNIPRMVGLVRIPEKFVNRIVWSPEMATLYLLAPGSTLYKENQRFVIWMPDKDEDNNRLEIPIREIERILAFGNIQLTAHAVHACLQSDILILLLNNSGQYQGHIWSLESTHLVQELTQIDRRQDPDFQFNISQAIVRGKLTNSKQLLLRLNRKRPVPEISQAIAGITKDILAVDAVDNLDSLRGYEGITAARYFPAFGQLITNPAFSFRLRNRQPPKDPVNSLLSFGYTILFNNVLSLIIAEGLSPYFGNFHYGEDSRHKPTLAFDLMEEFRSPIVDSLIIKLINNCIVKPSDFDLVKTTGGVYLNYQAKKTFLQYVEKRMNEMVSHPDVQTKVTYRQAIQLQVRRYKRYLLHGIAYQPFIRPV